MLMSLEPTEQNKRNYAEITYPFSSINIKMNNNLINTSQDHLLWFEKVADVSTSLFQTPIFSTYSDFLSDTRDGQGNAVWFEPVLVPAETQPPCLPHVGSVVSLGGSRFPPLLHRFIWLLISAANNNNSWKCNSRFTRYFFSLSHNWWWFSWFSHKPEPNPSHR